jgi:hypothetical protein
MIMNTYENPNTNVQTTVTVKPSPSLFPSSRPVVNQVSDKTSEK